MAVEVNASKTGFDAARAVQSTLAVDLTAPTAPTYTAPGSLQVGVAISAISPSGGSGIAEYGATGLPPGLNIDTATGVIGGTPDTADANAASATVTVSDAAGNTDPVPIAFPPVAKGDQTLTGFQYSSNTVMLESPAPTVTAPSGAQGVLSYSVTASTVCTVGSSTGVLTLVGGVGDCEVIATAADTANYNQATATYTVTVQPVAEPLIAPTAIAQTAGDSRTSYVIDHLINGSGLSDTPTTANLDTVTHSSGSTSAWVTQTDGNPDYFGDSRNFPDPQFTLTLDGPYSLSELVIWGYGGSTNEASDFTVAFSTDGGSSYSAATETVQTSGLVGNDHARLSFGMAHEANFVRLTITNNAKGRGFPGAGGDRVGLGEVRFVGSAVASNAPPGITLLRVDFDATALGEYTDSAFRSDWSSVEGGVSGLGSGRAEIIGGPSAFSGRSLRLKYPVGTYGSRNQAIQALMRLPENYEELYVSYRVRFAADFDFVKGGKLPGLTGGTANTGGNRPNGRDGWSGRMMWRRGGEAVQYLYHPDQPGIYGESFRWDRRFELGRWHTVEHRFVMNTPRVNDGILQTWFDGRQTLYVDNLRFRDVDSFAIDQFYISTFFGGGDDTWAPTKDEYISFDDFIISTARIQWFDGGLSEAGALVTLVNTAGNLDLSTLASDAEGGTLSYATTNPTNGSVILTGTVVTYTPNTGYFGSDSFTYTVTDGDNAPATATVRVTVHRAPTARDTWVTTPANTALTYDLSPLAFDPDGHTLEWSVGTATNGVVQLQSVTGGSVIYTPNAGFVGIDSFTYTVTDGHGAPATGTITVAVGAALLLNLNVIAGDDKVNIDEKVTGFGIGGDTGSVGGVSVTVRVGVVELTATSAAANPATWSVDVPGDASYISEPSVAVEVNASKTGYDAARAVQSTLAVDLTVPAAPTYTAPGSLQVGVAISAISPSGGSGIAEYGATGLPPGLNIDTATGVIGGTPDTADANAASATVTVTDMASATPTTVDDRVSAWWPRGIRR